MANNRMILICNVCVPKGASWKYGDKGILPLAKWYPEASYAPIRDEDDINKFLEEHHHPEVPSQYYKAGAGQENPVRLEYECEGLPIDSTLEKPL